MSKLKLLLASMLLVFAVGAIAAASASAEEPEHQLRWKVAGKVLAKGASAEIEAKAYKGSITLEAEKIKVSCTTIKVAKGATISNGGEEESAIGELTDELSSCTTEGGGEGCKVAEPIKTEPLRAEPVLNDLAPGTGRKVLVEFDPKAGTESKFVEIKFEGEKCKFKNIEIGKGLVVGSGLYDPETSEGLEGELELGEKVPGESASFLVKFPDEAKSIYLWKSGKWTLVEVKPLKVLLTNAKFTGTVLLKLKSGEKYGLTTEPEVKEKPEFVVEGLKEGETEKLSEEAREDVKPFVLEAEKEPTIECKKAKVDETVKDDSAEDPVTFDYEECKDNSEAACKLSKIETKPLEDVLEDGKNAEDTDEKFKPKEGEVIAEFGLEGSECKEKEKLKLEGDFTSKEEDNEAKAEKEVPINIEVSSASGELKYGDQLHPASLRLLLSLRPPIPLGLCRHPQRLMLSCLY
jgi:hypothetical protein